MAINIQKTNFLYSFFICELNGTQTRQHRLLYKQQTRATHLTAKFCISFGSSPPAAAIHGSFAICRWSQGGEWRWLKTKDTPTHKSKWLYLTYANIDILITDKFLACSELWLSFALSFLSLCWLLLCANQYFHFAKNSFAIYVDGSNLLIDFNSAASTNNIQMEIFVILSECPFIVDHNSSYQIPFCFSANIRAPFLCACWNGCNNIN